MFPITNWILVGVGILLGSLGSLLMKWGSSQLVARPQESLLGVAWSAAFNPFIVGGLLFYVIPAAIWIWLLRTMPLTILQPALSLTYVVSALLAVAVLNEPVPAGRWLGIFVIIAGVTMVARS